jgi:membrane protein
MQDSEIIQVIGKGIKYFFLKCLRAIGSSFTAFFRDECFELAGGMSFFMILSIAPLGILIVTIIGYVFGQYHTIYNYTLENLTHLFPNFSDSITQEIRAIIFYRKLSIISIILYSFLSFQFFLSMEHAVNVIFKVKRRRNYAISLLLSFFVVTLLLIFLLTAFIFSSIGSLIEQYSLKIVGIKIGHMASVFLVYIAPFLLVLLTYTAVYKIIPQDKISFILAFFSGLFATLFWEAAKYIFTWYVKNLSYLGSIYGSLTTFVFALIWIYYSSCIFLLGAELVKTCKECSDV